MEVIVGTAGHIDHGKTALVKALTGTDTDRLPEERSRGITIDLGFAEMSAGDTHFGFVDVPGHERFVRNMLAGASGIDLLLLVVAADEGVMPQTREHFDICRLLDIKAGVIAMTKSDLVNHETLELAKLDVAELVDGSFLENAPVIPVSSVNRTGIEDLMLALGSASSHLSSRTSDIVTRLPIDRSFSMKGFGTVVTGTLASGVIDANSRLELMPPGTPVRIRGVQTHGRSADSAQAGQRVAVNLAGIDHEAVTRGMTLVQAGALEPTQAIDVAIEVLKSASRALRSRQRVRVHLGTSEILARVQVLNSETEIVPGGRGLVQLRLESSAIAVAGERFIIRSYSPQVTIAGGRVLDPLADRHRLKDLKSVTTYLDSVRDAADNAAVLRPMIGRAGRAGLSEKTIRAKTGLNREVIASLAGTLGVEKVGDQYVDRGRFESLKTAVVSTLEQFHKKDPLAKGFSREAIAASSRDVSDDIMIAAVCSLEDENKVFVDGDTILLASHTAELSPEESGFSEKLFSTYETAGLAVPRLDEAVAAAGSLPRATADKLIRRLIDHNKLVKVTDEFYFSRASIDMAIRALLGSGQETIDVPAFKDLIGVSRKYAIPLLEYFDREHITARVGDKRVIVK